MPTATLPSKQLTIARRFRGPFHSGNGGYTAGVLARHLDGPVQVTLRLPPPLDMPLDLNVEDGQARLEHAGTVIAEAEPATVELEVPALPEPSEAQAARARFDTEHHNLPECFVCGPQRDAGDGLRLFTGPDISGRLALSPWTPEPQYADGNGMLRPEFIWAALDCPGYFGLMRAGLPALLGRMAARIDQPVGAGESLLVAGWHLGSEGRKHFAGSAICRPDGTPLALARSTWIELKNPQHR